MTDPASCRLDGEFAARRTQSDDEVVAGHCITCGDEGVEMTVLGLDATPGLAWCAAHAGEPALVEVSLLPPVGPGDHILVHAGTAIASLEAQS